MHPVVTALHLHPVKGLRGHPVPAADVERCGFAGDRRWMVIDRDGRFLSQRGFPAMARLTAKMRTNCLHLSVSSTDAIEIPIPDRDAPQITVSVWRSTLRASDAGWMAAAWLSNALDTPCRLVYLADSAARPVDPAYGTSVDRVSFADGFPVLLAAEASLDDLNTRLEQPIPMRRFRPNMVIGGPEPWAEDHWRRIRIGGVVFRRPKPCSRCAVTTVDQQTGKRPDPREPLRTLALFRRTRDGVMFGQNMIPETFGRVAVGDTVTVLESGPSNVVLVALQPASEN
jgi:uncharacterized protein